MKSFYRIFIDWVEITSDTKRNWTQQEIIEAYNNQRDLHSELIFETENKEKAEKEFEKLKERCITNTSQKNNQIVLRADVLLLYQDYVSNDGYIEELYRLDNYVKETISS